MPWMVHPERMTLKQRLYSVMADYPELFIARDSITAMASYDEKVMRFRSLLQKAHHVLEELEYWRQTWDSANPNCCWDVPCQTAAPVFIDTGGKTIPAWTSRLDYESLYHANSLTIYNATLILLLHFVKDITLMSSSDVGDPRSMDLSTNLYVACLKICRSIEYHLQILHEGAGSFYLLFPLRMAYDTVRESNPTVAAWIRDVLLGIHEGQYGKSGRWATAKYLLDISPLSNGIPIG